MIFGPNINGVVYNDENYQGSFNGANGCFSVKRKTVGTIGRNGSGNYHYYADFNASRSSAVYGKSSTIQPPSLQAILIIKI